LPVLCCVLHLHAAYCTPYQAGRSVTAATQLSGCSASFDRTNGQDSRASVDMHERNSLQASTRANGKRLEEFHRSTPTLALLLCFTYVSISLHQWQLLLTPGHLCTGQQCDSRGELWMAQSPLGKASVTMGSGEFTVVGFIFANQPFRCTI